MRRIVFLITVLAAFVWLGQGQQLPGVGALDSVDLRTMAAVVILFRDSHDAVWPGYDLSARPFLVYRPGQWGILMNPPEMIDSYEPYPTSWPRLGAPALLHRGAIGGLTGQLEFDYKVGSTTTVAIPLAGNLPDQPEPRARALFAFVVHEAFHQFQHSAFRSVDEPSEEQYPILDAQNNAYVALEMHILADAVQAAERSDSNGARRLIGMFLAVRRFRWERSAPLVRAFERAKELTEGTAKYVETRLLAQMAAYCRAHRSPAEYPCPALHSFSAAGYLRDDFDSRLDDGALSPANVPRNRIYPAGASIGILLDFFGIEWKSIAMSLPDSSTLADLLAPSVRVPVARFDSLRLEAERRYDLPRVQQRTQVLIDNYISEANSAIRAFEAQPGFRVEVQLPAGGTSRSRSSTGKRWVVGAGKRVFGEFLVYTLRRRDQSLLLEVERKGVLDDLLSGGERRVTFFAPSVDSILVDGAPLAITSAGDHPFASLHIKGAGFSLNVKAPGTLTLSTNGVEVRLSQRFP